MVHVLDILDERARVFDDSSGRYIDGILVNGGMGGIDFLSLSTEYEIPGLYPMDHKLPMMIFSEFINSDSFTHLETTDGIHYLAGKLGDDIQYPGLMLNGRGLGFITPELPDYGRYRERFERAGFDFN